MQKKTSRIDLLLKSLMWVLFFAGASVFSYPFFVDAVNNVHDQWVMIQYKKEQETYQEEQKQRLEEMQLENEKLLAENKYLNIPGIGIVEDPFSETLSKNTQVEESYLQEHTLGALFIPEIHVSLPIFDETNSELLEIGATVLQGTSFPVGGSSTHAVITGHSGLAEKKLFTDLEKLEAGDLFYLEIAGEKLAYEVCELQTVLPTELEKLRIIEGEDLVTLVTCTPYMINTHRLLVTGVRVPFPETAVKEIQEIQTYHVYHLFLLILGLIVCLLLAFFWARRIFVDHQSSKKNYTFLFTIKHKQRPLAGQIFYLIEKKQHKPVMKNGELYTAVSDEKGRVCFEEILGGKYIVQTTNELQLPKVTGYIRRLKDRTFSLKIRNSADFQLSRGKK